VPDDKKCLIVGCDNIVYRRTTGKLGRGARGLCGRCYRAAFAGTKRKRWTWEKLEEMGLCLPLEQGRVARKSDPFGKAVEEAESTKNEEPDAGGK
jgi:hypothetical protein